MLLFTLKPIGPTTIQATSWIEGKKKATTYWHGEYFDMSLLIKSIQARANALDIPVELGEYR
jgi:hypothetical protein